MITPLELLKQTPLWNWTPPVKTGRCESCRRETELLASDLCGSCLTLTRTYDGQSQRLIGKVFVINSQRALLFAKAENPELQFSDKVEGHYSEEWLRRAFEHVMVPANRKNPYLFILFQSKRGMSPSDLVLNVDPDFLFISTNLPRPDNSAQQFPRVIDLEEVRDLKRVQMGRMKDADRKRLLAEGFTEEEFITPHWRLAQTLAGGRSNAWF